MNRLRNFVVILFLLTCLYLFGLPCAASADPPSDLGKAITDLTSLLKNADQNQLKSNADALSKLQSLLTCAQSSPDCRVQQLQDLVASWTDSVTLTDAQAAKINKAAL